MYFEVIELVIREEGHREQMRKRNWRREREERYDIRSIFREIRSDILGQELGF